jgi:DNA processing protein
MVSEHTRNTNLCPRHVRQVVYGDPLYPSNLESSTHITMSLWYCGQLKKDDRVAVAVVGSRSCSPEGKARAFKLGAQLAEEKISVVSGLALGVDGAAHRGALSVGGRTLAVLGTGLQHVYPTEHDQLADSIIGVNSAILSQFMPYYKGSKGGKNFLQRNHVIAGLSQVMIAVEGKERSGTTAAIQATLAQGRPVGLLRSLVESQKWAKGLVESGQAFQVNSIDDVIGRVSF